MRAFFKENISILLLPAVFLICISLRPPLPVDETRYLTVAWEMWFKQDWIHLSYNFEPYHHKPPLMFWLINIFWSVFGVSRLAATLPAVICSVLAVVLTGRLAKNLFPSDPDMARNSQLLLTGSVPFLMYGSLIMFDVMMTVWVLGAWLFILRYAERRRFVYILGLGLCMGMGVLTKGPVIYIYALLPALLVPYWMDETKNQEKLSWYGGVLVAVFLSLVPVLAWLVPLVLKADSHFLYWLLWEQSAGRITGGFSNAHIRPFYFYIPLLPLFFLPWILFPSFWRNARQQWKAPARPWGFRFIVCAVVSAFVAFSLITGKQPHYLVPLVPAFMIASAFLWRDISFGRLRAIAVSMMAMLLMAHVIASRTIFPSYDWKPIADIVAQHPEKELAYVTNYNGEIGFLARLTRPLTSTSPKKLPLWFKEHPDGLAVIRYRTPEEVARFEPLYTQSYRGSGYAGVFRAKKP